MANYNIDWQSGGDEGIPGKTDISLPENTFNAAATPITLTGRGVKNYGEIQQENFIRLMENFASATPPANPTIGMLWYDTTSGVRVPKVYDYSEVWLPLIVGDTSGFITLAGDPTSSLHPVTKQYVDSIVSGLLPQTPVVAATTAPVVLAGVQTIDGVSVIAGDRVLVKDQASLIQNGIYVAAVGAWSRAPDFDGAPSGEVVSGMSYSVAGGTVNGGDRFSLTTPNPVVVGVSNITFTLVIDYIAYTNIGNNFTVSQNFNAGFDATGNSTSDGSFVSTGLTFTDGSLVQKYTALSNSGTVTVDLSLGDLFAFSVSAVTVVNFTNPQPAPRSHVFLLEITNGGSSTVQFPPSVVWNAGVTPTLKITGVDVLGFTTIDGGTTYRGVLIAGGGTGGTYTLPTASASVLGGVKVGSGLSIDGSGILSASGIGTDVTLTGDTYIDGRLEQKANNRGSISGAQTLDLALGDIISCTITGNTTFTFTNPAVTGRVSAFIIEMTNGGTATITWPASVSWVSGTAPTLRTGGGKNVIGFFTRDGGTTYQSFLIA